MELLYRSGLYFDFFYRIQNLIKAFLVGPLYTVHRAIKGNRKIIGRADILEKLHRPPKDTSCRRI